MKDGKSFLNLKKLQIEIRLKGMKFNMKLKNNKGITGIEVAISVTILTIFVSLIGTLSYNTSITAKKVERKSVATNLAINTIEKMKLKGYENLEVSNSVQLDELDLQVPNGYDVSAVVEDYQNEDIVKVLSVNVEYQNGKKTEDVNLKTIIVKE